MINRLKHRIAHLRGMIHLDTGAINNTVLLTGTGRSGTTWLEDVINFDNCYRIIFEPFHNQQLPRLKDWHYRQYLRPDDARFNDIIHTILAGKVRSSWTDKFNHRFLAKHRLIKDIRTHFIMNRIYVHYPDIPQILLLRHPCAIALSKIKLGWHTDLSIYTEQKELVQDHFAPFIDIINRAETDFEKHMVQWCLENIVPLRQFQPGEILVCFYENLCEQPEAELSRLFDFLGRADYQQAIDSMAIPSAMSQADSAIHHQQNPVDHWQSLITDEQRQQADNIFAAFGLDSVYTTDSRPKVSADEILSLFQ